MGQVEKFLQHNGLLQKTILQLMLCIEELVSNTILHGTDGSLTTSILLGMQIKDGVLRIRIEDQARPYNPLELRDPDTTLGLEARPIGGLGVFLTKRYVDSLHYEYRDGRNVLTLTKNLPEPIPRIT